MAPPQVIWKYKLDVGFKTTLTMPKSARVMGAASQLIDGERGIFVWAIVDAGDKETQKREFRVLATGVTAEDIRQWRFIDIVQMPPEPDYPHGFVFHVFELWYPTGNEIHGATRHPC